MTAQEIIEKIRAEIERLKAEHQTPTIRGDEYEEGGINGYHIALDKVLAKLDTLQEQPVCEFEPKFNVGDRIQFKGFGHNKYTIAKVNVDDNRYVDTYGNGMDMSYTDANFELVKEKPVCEGLEEEIDRLWNSFADEMEGPHNIFDVYARLARHFAQWGAEHLHDTTKKVEGLEKAARLYAIPHYMKDVDESHLEDYPFDTGLEIAFIEGAKWQKEQMMKEAVEARVFNVIPSRSVVKYDAYYPDGVPQNDRGVIGKLIFVKED